MMLFLTVQAQVVQDENDQTPGTEGRQRWTKFLHLMVGDLCVVPGLRKVQQLDMKTFLAGLFTSFIASCFVSCFVGFIALVMRPRKFYSAVFCVVGMANLNMNFTSEGFKTCEC